MLILILILILMIKIYTDCIIKFLRSITFKLLIYLWKISVLNKLIDLKKEKNTLLEIN